MNPSQSISLSITGFREKVIILTEEFDAQNKFGTKNYSQRLDRFIKRRLRNVADKLLFAQIIISINSLRLQQDLIK